MSDKEFWASTLAKVTAIYDIKIKGWNKTRDFFTAYCVAVGLNMHRTEGFITPEQILGYRYSEESVTVTHDPDFGAAGSWESLRAGLKGSEDDGI